LTPSQNLAALAAVTPDNFLTSARGNLEEIICW
jgi:hypothetical protein